jgi:hypothetical protein
MENKMTKTIVDTPAENEGIIFGRRKLKIIGFHSGTQADYSTAQQQHKYRFYEQCFDCARKNGFWNVWSSSSHSYDNNFDEQIGERNL